MKLSREQESFINIFSVNQTHYKGTLEATALGWKTPKSETVLHTKSVWVTWIFFVFNIKIIISDTNFMTLSERKFG